MGSLCEPRATETVEGFEDDLDYLNSVWDNIQAEKKTARSPALIFEELQLTHRLVRDQIRRDTERVWIDSLETFTKLSQFVSKFMPDLAHLLQHYRGDRPIFDMYQIEEEIEKALSRQVDLKSGAYLVIDQTEAMTTIDVNTGGFVGSHTLEQTVSEQIWRLQSQLVVSYDSAIWVVLWQSISSI